MIDASGGDTAEEEKADEVVGEDSEQTPVAKCPVKKSDQDRKLTDEEIVAHALTFFLAGYETTANTLAYTSYLLAINPEIQEKLQSEIDSYFDENPVSYLSVELSTNACYPFHYCRNPPIMKQVSRLPTWTMSSKNLFVYILQLRGISLPI